MRVLTYKSDCNSKSVKQIIKNYFDLSSSLVTRLKNSGGIKVNDQIVTVRHMLNFGDVLTLEVPVDVCSIKPVAGEIYVLYEDEDILCVNKPRNMPTHPSQNHYDDTLANLVMHYFKETDNTFHAVNRLDAYTSGIVVIAKNAYSASVLSGRLSDFIYDKKYTAVCNGIFEQKQGRIIAPIAREPGSSIKRCISSSGKYSETLYSVIDEVDGNSIVEVSPLTGRTHQIRLHMAHIGHSLVNDFLYDVNSDGESMFYLHCNSLTLIHPHTKQTLKIKAPEPCFS